MVTEIVAYTFMGFYSVGVLFLFYKVLDVNREVSYEMSKSHASSPGRCVKKIKYEGFVKIFDTADWVCNDIFPTSLFGTDEMTHYGKNYIHANIFCVNDVCYVFGFIDYMRVKRFIKHMAKKYRYINALKW